jgi:hypothetical protein
MNFLCDLPHCAYVRYKKHLGNFILPPLCNHLCTFCISLTKTFVTKNKSCALT